MKTKCTESDRSSQETIQDTLYEERIPEYLLIIKHHKFLNFGPLSTRGRVEELFFSFALWDIQITNVGSGIELLLLNICSYNRK